MATNTCSELFIMCRHHTTYILRLLGHRSLQHVQQKFLPFLLMD